MIKEWKTKSFVECIEKPPKHTKVLRKNFLQQGDYPIISQEIGLINGYWKDEKDLLAFEKPVIIFGDHTKIIKYVDFNFVAGADGVKILQTKDFIVPRFFFYFLTSVNIKPLGYARHYRLLKELQISFPENIREQKRIVSILDESFEAIDIAKANTEKNLQNARALFESELNACISQCNENWKAQRLDEICNIVGGGTPSKDNEEYYGGSIPWATVRDLKSDTLTSTEHTITSDAVKKSSTKIIPGKNVVIATRVGLGKICLLEQDTAINQDLRGIVPKDNSIISSHFLFWWFKSIAQMIVAEGTGATVQGVKLPFIKSLKIPIPPTENQNIIVNKLDSIKKKSEHLETIYQKKLVALEELKKSLLHQAFNGEL